MAPRHLKIGRERAFSIVCHTMCLFLTEAITLAIIWLEIVKKHYNEFCDNIYQSSLGNKADSVNIIFQHMLRLGSL